MKTPTTVIQAFAPETEFELTIEATLVLESLDCGFITGSHTPGIRDIMLALLAMTDLPALKKARREKAVDDFLERAGRDSQPRELLALLPAISEAIAAATQPAGQADALDGDGEKKSKADAGGG